MDSFNIIDLFILEFVYNLINLKKFINFKYIFSI